MTDALIERLERGAKHDGRSSDWWVDYCATIHEAAQALKAKDAEIAELREALKPFAEYMNGGIDCDNHGDPLPNENGVGWVYLTVGDFRAARKALGGSDGE